MEAKLVKMQTKYCENGRITWFDVMGHDIRDFFDNLPKMQDNANIDWRTHPKFDWECHCHVKKNRETLMAHTSMFHTKWGMCYLLLPIWTKRSMDFGHLPTHVPSTMPNHFDGGKEEMSTMSSISPMPI